MCYSGSCVYEDYYGDCAKPRGVPCPANEEALAEYDSLLEWQSDRLREMELENE